LSVLCAWFEDNNLPVFNTKKQVRKNNNIKEYIYISANKHMFTINGGKIATNGRIQNIFI